MISTYINDCSAAVQVFVQVIQHLSEPLHVLLVWLKQHGLEVDGKSIPNDAEDLSSARPVTASEIHAFSVTF